MLSGVVLWASDTGGYLGGDASDPVWRELLVRWTQFSALCPIFRWHGKRVGGEPPDACGPTNGANEPWAVGEGGLAALTRMFELRERLREQLRQAGLARPDPDRPHWLPLISIEDMQLILIDAGITPWTPPV